MPVITFIKDIMAKARGAYYYQVARHTQLFCQRAASQADNPQQRRMFFVCAAAADEAISGLLKLGPGSNQSDYILRRTGKVSKQAVLGAMKVYLSALLVLLGTQRDQVLASTVLDEQVLLKKWCSIYDYNIEDRQLFNETLLTAFKSGGLEALTQATGHYMLSSIFITASPLESKELSAIERALVVDLTAILRNIGAEKAG
ncbi:hypothetical protein HA075_12780 [bacterium BFN5]|nr:hypothetical protein HA075_12685 [bacterium BFN5]QJW46629.1 hypothetical protein HA075_12780 [bacterium BFN5]